MTKLTFFHITQPDPSEIKKVAAEGILTCLQDALDSLKQGQVCNFFSIKFASKIMLLYCYSIHLYFIYRVWER